VQARRLAAPLAAVAVSAVVVALLWPTAHHLRVDEALVRTEAVLAAPSTVQPLGCSVRAGRVRCRLGDELYDGRLHRVGALPPCEMVRVQNEAKGWFIEVPTVLPLFDDQGNEYVATTGGGTLTIRRYDEDPAVDGSTWSALALQTSHPPVALLFHGANEIVAVFPFRILVLDLLADRQPRSVLDEQADVLNWSADLQGDDLAVGRSGAVVILSLQTRTVRTRPVPASAAASWAQVRGVAFVAGGRLAVALGDPRAERCRLYVTDQAGTRADWGQGTRLPYTDDDGLVFVHQPAVAWDGTAGRLLLFTAQSLVGGGTAVVQSVDVDALP